MSNRYIIPLGLSELNSWYVAGDAGVLAYRLFPLTHDTPAVLRKRAARMLPPFQDDFEVMYAEVHLEEPLPVQEASDGVVLPIAVDLRFEQIRCVHAATQRGLEMLKTRLPPSVKMEGLLFGPEGQEEDERRLRARSERGAEALLIIAGLSDRVGAMNQIEPDVWNAVRLRDREVGFPVKGGSFLSNLFNYDRRDPTYPHTPLGYAYDYGKTALDYSEPHDALKQALRGLRTELTRLHGEGVSDTWTSYDILRPHLTQVTELTDDRFPAASCLAFLQIQDEVRQNGQLGDGFDHVMRSAKGLGLEDEVAKGLYLAGSFFGFAPFAEAYYAEVSDAKLADGSCDGKPANNAHKKHSSSKNNHRDPDLFGGDGRDPDTESSEADYALGSDEWLTPRGGGLNAIKKDPLWRLAQMLYAAVVNEGNGKQLHLEKAQDIILEAFNVRSKKPNLERIDRALEEAKKQRLLTVDDNGLLEALV